MFSIEPGSAEGLSKIVGPRVLTLSSMGFSSEIDFAQCLFLSALEYWCQCTPIERPRRGILSCYAHADNFLSTLTDRLACMYYGFYFVGHYCKRRVTPAIRRRCFLDFRMSLMLPCQVGRVPAHDVKPTIPGR